MNSRTIVIGLTLFCLFCSQRTLAQQSYFGIKFGPNVTNQEFLSTSNMSYMPENKIRPHIGLLYSKRIIRDLSIQPEVLLSSQGHGTAPFSSIPRGGLKFYYLNIPLMVKYHLSSSLNLHLGPQLGFLLGGDKLEGMTVTKISKLHDVSWGFGFEKFVSDNVALGVRLNTGITNIFNGQSERIVRKENRVIQFSVIISPYKQ
ncbi:MAG: porin family protein [Bacteroidota bacterium]